jgi:hypothetical protein
VTIYNFGEMEEMLLAEMKRSQKASFHQEKRKNQDLIKNYKQIIHRKGNTNCC